MARLIPDDWKSLAATGAAERERETLAALEHALPDSYTVYHGVHWTRADQAFSVFGEAAFVVVGRSRAADRAESRLPARNAEGREGLSAEGTQCPDPARAHAGNAAPAPDGRARRGCLRRRGAAVLPRLLDPRRVDRRRRGRPHRRCIAQGAARAGDPADPAGGRRTLSERAEAPPLPRGRAALTPDTSALVGRPARSSRGCRAGRRVGAPARIRAVPVARHRHGRLGQDAARGAGDARCGRGRQARALRVSTGRSPTTSRASRRPARKSRTTTSCATGSRATAAIRPTSRYPANSSGSRALRGNADSRALALRRAGRR